MCFVTGPSVLTFVCKRQIAAIFLMLVLENHTSVQSQNWMTNCFQYVLFIMLPKEQTSKIGQTIYSNLFGINCHFASVIKLTTYMSNNVLQVRFKWLFLTLLAVLRQGTQCHLVSSFPLVCTYTYFEIFPLEKRYTGHRPHKFEIWNRVFQDLPLTLKHANLLPRCNSKEGSYLVWIWRQLGYHMHPSRSCIVLLTRKEYTFYGYICKTSSVFPGENLVTFAEQKQV